MIDQPVKLARLPNSFWWKPQSIFSNEHPPGVWANKRKNFALEELRKSGITEVPETGWEYSLHNGCDYYKGLEVVEWHTDQLSNVSDIDGLLVASTVSPTVYKKRTGTIGKLSCGFLWWMPDMLHKAPVSSLGNPKRWFFRLGHRQI